jgi:acetolactate synthase-1/2/3 large subunit
VRAAQADGFEYAVRLDRKDDVPRVVADFIGFPGPAFLEVLIDPDACVYPMVGPGMTYDQMITGDFIPSRGAPKPAGPAGNSSMF